MTVKKYIIALLGVFIIASCKKSFLDVPDKTAILRQAYVKDLKTMGDYLNGVYYEFAVNFYTGLALEYPDIISDNLKPAVSFANSHYSWDQKANNDKTVFISGTNSNSNGLWYSGYRIIRNCNFIIENVENFSSENPSKANDYKGQAYALRAFAHFILTNVFAQPYSYTDDGEHLCIPYVINSDINTPLSKQSANEVYSRLISDLNSAIELLPNNYSDTRYMNKGAAKALLARVLLFNEEFSAAKNISNEINNQFPLMTVANGYPNALYSLKPSSGTESLFQLPPSATGVITGAGNYYTNFAGMLFSGTILLKATNDIASVLKENSSDARSAWVAPDGLTWNVKKFPANVVSGFTTQGAGAYYQTVIRTSEMYLTSAEAYARLNMDDSARYYLNALRKRANPSIALITDSGAPLLDSIYKERRKELAFEGLRMFDLLRWKKGVTRGDATNNTVKSLTYPNDKAIAPLPLSDVDISGLEQNLSY